MAELDPRIRTHRLVRDELSGQVVELAEGRAQVKLVTNEVMLADEQGLVHGGFVFSLADYAAMLAVNHPNVVLGKAEVRFLRPVVLGDVLLANAEVVDREEQRRVVVVRVTRAGDMVFQGELTCHVLEQHVLEGAS